MNHIDDPLLEPLETGTSPSQRSNLLEQDLLSAYRVNDAKGELRRILKEQQPQ